MNSEDDGSNLRKCTASHSPKTRWKLRCQLAEFCELVVYHLSSLWIPLHFVASKRMIVSCFMPRNLLDLLWHSLALEGVSKPKLGASPNMLGQGVAALRMTAFVKRSSIQVSQCATQKAGVYSSGLAEKTTENHTSFAMRRSKVLKVRRVLA